MMEHLSSLHSCCEYCDTVNIQLSNKASTFYGEKQDTKTPNSKDVQDFTYINENYLYVIF